MGIRTVLAAVGACGLLVLASLLVLRWTGDAVADLNLAPSMPDDAGDPLDPAAVEWLSWAPPRTVVEPTALRDALAELETFVAGLVPFRATDPPSPVVDRIQIPSGWGDSDVVDVLTGAERWAVPTGDADRCTLLSRLADRLSRADWRVTMAEEPAIQTAYPLATPGPVDVTLTGAAPGRTLSLHARADGVLHLRMAVDGESGVATEPESPPSAPAPAGPCAGREPATVTS